MKPLLVALACSLVSSTAHAQDDDPAPPRARPPISTKRIAGEAWLGAFVGGMGGLAGAGIGYKLGGDDLQSFGVGGYAGFTLTVPLGVYWASTVGDQAGSLSWTYAGAALGGATGVLTFLAADKSGSDSSAVWVPAIGVGLAAPIVGAIIGANLSRAYDRRASSTAVVPMISIHGERSMVGIAGRL